MTQITLDFLMHISTSTRQYDNRIQNTDWSKWNPTLKQGRTNQGRTKPLPPRPPPPTLAPNVHQQLLQVYGFCPHFLWNQVGSIWVTYIYTTHFNERGRFYQFWDIGNSNSNNNNNNTNNILQKNNNKNNNNYSYYSYYYYYNKIKKIKIKNYNNNNNNK